MREPQTKEAMMMGDLVVHMIDTWYLAKKEQLKGRGPHWLGRDKEHAKEIAYDALTYLVDKYSCGKYAKT